MVNNLLESVETVLKIMGAMISAVVSTFLLVRWVLKSYTASIWEHIRALEEDVDKLNELPPKMTALEYEAKASKDATKEFSELVKGVLNIVARRD